MSERGYTLIEVLIAVGIFSALSLAAYSALDAISKAKVASETHAEVLADLQWVLQRFESDMQSLVARPRLNGADGSDFFGQANGLGGIRSGWANPLDQPRSQLQRFQYQWSSDGLVRSYWPRLYGDAATVPQQEPLTDGSVVVSFRYFSPELGWQSSWSASAVRAWPMGIEITLDHPQFGPIRRRVVVQ